VVALSSAQLETQWNRSYTSDGSDAQVAPGVVFDPVPRGLSLEDMEEVIRSAFTRFRVRACTLAVYNPERDQNDNVRLLGRLEIQTEVR
jgi:arginase family enzyme